MLNVGNTRNSTSSEPGLVLSPFSGSEIITLSKGVRGPKYTP